MNEQKREILWESYHIEDFELEVHSVESVQEDDGEEVSNDFDAALLQKRLSKLPRIVPTPFGLCRADDKMNPLRRFTFWVGHTNFDITGEIGDVLDNIPGVEVLMINTRYRFIIGIAQLFKDTEVKMLIEQKLCGKHMVEFWLRSIENPEIKEQIKEEYKKIKHHAHWALYLFPNGKIYTYGGEDKNKFMEEYNLLLESRSASSGILLSSEDEVTNTQG